MMKDIVKVEREGNAYVLFNTRGMVLELTEEEYALFRKHGNQKRFPAEHADFFNTLTSYGMTSFEEYTPAKAPLRYSRKLLTHQGETPVFKAPLIAHLGLTSQCNMRCAYCSVRQPYNALKELSTAQWKSVITKLCSLGVFQIGLTGGEPTLRKDIVELARHITAQKATFNLTTNCWALTEELIHELKDAGMRQCQLSLDCHLPEVNDALRQKGSCERVKSAMRLLKRQGITVGIDCVVSNNNIAHIPGLVRWLASEEIPYLTLIKLKQGDLPLERFRELLPGYGEYSRLIESLCNRRNENPCVTVDCGSVSNLHYTLKEHELDRMPVAGCPVGHTLLSIAPNADVFPCVALSAPEFRLGNALTDDLAEMWQTNGMLRQLRQVKRRVEGKCGSCPRLDYCRGGCRGIVYALSQRLWQSDNTCERR